MQLQKIRFSDTKSFSQFFLDYIENKERLTPFFDQYPALVNFNSSLTKKSQSFLLEQRQILVSVLKKQYDGIQHEIVHRQIQSLSDGKTFTVTTGHQLNIFTGPLYFIYKIVTVINTCRELKKKYPTFNFVPVYWMASEDHDYDEMNYFRLNGKKYTWETDQKGAVGRFKTIGFDKLLNELPGDTSIFREAYTGNEVLSDAVRQYVHSLFGNEGLVVIDADNHELKRQFSDVMRDDILQQRTITHVEKTNKELENLGYKTQIHCREINFFYLDTNLRTRIEKSDDGFSAVDTGLTFTEKEMLSIIEDVPEKLSPNVILRPLYQEMILPNLAYVGGPAEVIYWLQLKRVFDQYNVPFPVLMPRNFGMVVDHVVDRKLRKTGMAVETFFETKNYLFNEWISVNTRHDLTVGKERDLISRSFDELRLKASSIDPTLTPFVSAETKRALNGLEKLEKKLLRAEKRVHSEKLRQIEEVKDALFPNGNLQERTDNFLNFYQRDADFIKALLLNFDPFDFRFNILIYPSHDESRSAEAISSETK